MVVIWPSWVTWTRAFGAKGPQKHQETQVMLSRQEITEHVSEYKQYLEDMMEAVALSSFTAVPSTAAYLDCSISPPQIHPCFLPEALLILT